MRWLAHWHCSWPPAARRSSLPRTGIHSAGIRYPDHELVGDDARTETYQQAIQAFEAKLQYITVETIYGTTADEDQTADVMQVDWTWPGQNADQFVDLNEYSDVIDLEQFSQSALDACTVDGALLAVPMSVTGRIFIGTPALLNRQGSMRPKPMRSC